MRFSHLKITCFAAAALLLVAVSAFAADNDPIRASTERARSGAGLRIGAWSVDGMPTGPGASQTPAVEGYFQKGIDAHLVWENTIGYWSDRYVTSQAGLLGSSQTRVTAHLVPSVTALKVYPFTRRAAPVEPFALAGVGAVLGITQTQTIASGTATPDNGVTFLSGLGLRAGGGADWHWTPEFGMSAGVRYQWASFAQAVGSRAMYKGPVFDAGLTYRFQY
jgi:hypothetical protein